MPDATAVAPEAATPKLDELMLAMDVVDTLRHQDQLVEKELGQDNRDEALKKRLREIYESQGLEVTDRILDQGIAALKESRFVYTPPTPGFDTFLAGLWVRRGTVSKVLAVLVVIIAAFWGWQAWQQSAADKAADQERIEVTETLPAALRQAADAAREAATDADAKAEVEQLIGEGEAAIAAKDAAAMRQATAALAALTTRLNRTYQLRIVARPGEQTGVYRIPDVNTQARNYYIIVEAVTGDGEVLSMPITSEEDGKTTTVTKWGVRVPEATFEKVRADKSDDGIVQNNVLGEKPRGTLKVDYLMPVSGGAITEW
mgnify:CR=1 FL=1